MKTMKLIELERQRLALFDEARAVFAEITANTDQKLLQAAETKHDAAMRSIDQINLDIAEEQLRADDGPANKEAREARRPGGYGNMSGSDDSGQDDFARAWSSEKRSGWADPDGKPVRVLGPTDRLAPDQLAGVGMGDVVRAMITGPRNDIERRAVSEGTNSAGGYTVPVPLAMWYIDRLRSESVVMRAGAQTVPMDSQTLAIARLETDPAIGWRAENAALANGDPTFGRVLFTAKSLAGILKISRELLADTVNAGSMIEQALARAMALEMDRAALYGDGTGNSPIGVINVSGINEASMGINGAQLANYDPLIDAMYEMQLDNAADATAAIMHPRTMASLAKLKDAQSNPLTIPAMVARVPMLHTTSAPIAEIQGTATNASSIIYGDFSQMFIGVRETITIQLLNELYASEGAIGLAVHARMDMQLAHKESFSRLKGIKP